MTQVPRTTTIAAYPIDDQGNLLTASTIGTEVASAIGGGGSGTPQTPVSGNATATASDALPANPSRTFFSFVNNGTVDEIRLCEGFDADANTLVPIQPGGYYESTAKTRVSVFAASSTAYTIQERTT